MKQKENIHKFKLLLLEKGVMGAMEIARSLNISQPTVSRLINSIKHDIIKLGNGKSTKYALRRKLDFLPPPINEAKQNIYLINESGEAQKIAEMYPVGTKSFYINSFSPKIKSSLYPNIPYWLNDLRPSGFLGRLIPKKHLELSFPTDIRLWNTDCTISYWINLGWDLIGNIVIGDEIFKKISAHRESPQLRMAISKRAKEYPRIAVLRRRESTTTHTSIRHATYELCSKK